MIPIVIIERRGTHHGSGKHRVTSEVVQNPPLRLPPTGGLEVISKSFLGDTDAEAIGQAVLEATKRLGTVTITIHPHP